MTGAGGSIAFVKADGCGNDFLVIEERLFSGDRASLTRRLCDRHTGVGADGVEWVGPGDGECDIQARLYNSDGSEAEISGNGTRCVAAYHLTEHPGESVRVRTGAGVKTCRLESREGKRFEISMAIGVPRIEGERRVKTAAGEFSGWVVSMGNPHFVVLCQDFSFPWRHAGMEIQREFAGGVNVEFVRVLSDHDVESRFFERGVGETQSSGTGSCASAAAVIAAVKATSPVRVKAPGGTQSVEWAGKQETATLRGPAQIICRESFTYR